MAQQEAASNPLRQSTLSFDNTESSSSSSVDLSPGHAFSFIVPDLVSTELKPSHLRALRVQHAALLSSSVDESEVALNARETRQRPFRLNPDFVARYANIPPPFGFNGFGLIVFLSHYARLNADGTPEQWYQTCERVTNGTYNMQKRWVEEQDIGWKPNKAQRSAQEFFDRMFNLKFCPPGRGLWAMGTAITETAHAYAALNNCAFVSTELCGVPGHETERPFYVGMDMLMFGIGVGFDTRAAQNSVPVYAPFKSAEDAEAQGKGNRYMPARFVVPDSREGWVESLKLLLQTYFSPDRTVLEFDYSQVRPAGQPLRTFGGTSGGPEPLIQLHNHVRATLDRRANQCLSTTDIVDVYNHIGVCVVAGNIRRSAEIAFADNGNEEFMNLKNYERNPERAAYGWASNNTVFCKVGDDYNRIAELIAKNGEPGVCWLQNMQEYSRMGRKPTMKDMRAKGGNPCLEQTLESYELCCLVETFPERHFGPGVSEKAARADYMRTLKFAYLFAKTVTLGKTPWVETNRVMLRNRRIGTSITGVAQFLARVDNNWNTLKRWLHDGYDVVQYYDDVYSKWLVIPMSIKTTTVKPSGTVSLLAGSTPGIHFPESRFYLRRKTFAKKDPRDAAIVELLRDLGYHVEQSVTSDARVCVSFPIDAGTGVRPQAEVSMWEQFELAAFMQEHWSDNQVSATVTFDEKEAKDIAHALSIFQSRLKGVSMLKKNTTEYAQKPYEAISEEQYLECMRRCKPLSSKQLYDAVIHYAKTNKDIDDKVLTEPVAERFCDGDQCVL